jgi:twitching motility protein PilU
MEILMDTPYIRDLIKKGEIDTIKHAMETSRQEGGQTFDQSLFDLYAQGRISAEQALVNADSGNNLRILIKNFDLRQEQASRTRSHKAEPGGLRIQGMGGHARR